jgi:hypothetical protein
MVSGLCMAVFLTACAAPPVPEDGGPTSAWVGPVRFVSLPEAFALSSRP